MGKLSHEDTLNQIARSKALISTSPMEGFPNVFIEAWTCGIPVLSLHVDPGGVIEKEGLGIVAHGDMNKLLKAMKSIDSTENFARKSIAYVNENHQLNSDRINKIETIFTQPAPIKGCN
jgi:glycosyltransferase involved in cell wall biosynthesis